MNNKNLSIPNMRLGFVVILPKEVRVKKGKKREKKEEPRGWMERGGATGMSWKFGTSQY